MRAAGSDETVKLVPHHQLSLDQALEFIRDDECVEVTPTRCGCASWCSTRSSARRRRGRASASRSPLRLGLRHPVIARRGEHELVRVRARAWLARYSTASATSFMSASASRGVSRVKSAVFGDSIVASTMRSATWIPSCRTS